jgi:hypothetical protein
MSDANKCPSEAHICPTIDFKTSGNIFIRPKQTKRKEVF